MKTTFKTLKSVKIGCSLIGTLKNYRLVFRTNTLDGHGTFTVAINNSIQGNYKTELEAVEAFNNLIK